MKTPREWLDLAEDRINDSEEASTSALMAIAEVVVNEWEERTNKDEEKVKTYLLNHGIFGEDIRNVDK